MLREIAATKISDNVSFEDASTSPMAMATAAGDPEVVRNIIEEIKASDVELTSGFDAITENDTSQLLADILSATGNGKGKFVLTVPSPEEYPRLEDVEVFMTVAARLGTDAQDVGA
ncbi:uncharacterized protein Bfra_011439 [Botrytis fragariae]|uniref:Uncharacterized protein n=1 Tax=Botrytis fragariae TaxID=1964551 RepID=A0A8H6AY57_9HELO|nr:uncharacterized protein Bfra_011439 [Botrytis fragariae]KAF5875677.1 hypothetical protein Bfra_011439 [Botrytis fragariae]